ncbi:aldehyde dehydrogenase family protein [Pseudomonas fluorescens]|uniref:aldehyde dehydrogenase family protein n=1 Tax=Pseudomonas fluorescens TaxID=294 RepID=UPI00031D99FA|nr:aldehyde dehydrogenase family protein [Pseudomonas fluorescens]
MDNPIKNTACDSISVEALTFIQSEKGHFINGDWIHAGSRLDIVDPSTETVLGRLYEADQSIVADAVLAARQAFDGDTHWRRIGPHERERLLHKLADAIEADGEVLADLIAAELGLPKQAALNFEVAKTVQTFRYYAGFPTKIAGQTLDLGPEMGDGEFFSYTTHEPVGVVGAIIPWNAPLLVGAWKIAPALAAGCTIVVKPAEDVSVVLLRLAKLVKDVGIPDGVFNVVTGRGSVTGQALLDSHGVDKFAFTGSTAVGKHIYRAAADRIVRISLELGGKNPAIVFEDADVDAIAPALCMAAFANSGQICVSGSKVIAHKAIAGKLAGAMAKFCESLKVGSPFCQETMIGPVCSKAQFDKVSSFIDEAKQSGRLLSGGKLDYPKGYFIQPTIVCDLPADSRLLHEEIFGPVITLETWDNEENLLATINNSKFGLCASLWGNHHGRLQYMAKRIRTGTVFINTPAFPPVSMPTGGFRESGVGRDLGTKGLEGFLEVKSVIARIK